MEELDFKFNEQNIFQSVPNIPESEFEDVMKGKPYKRMYNFFFKGFTEVPLLMDYKYLLRLDGDTCLLDHINFDVFEFFNHKKAAYAYSHLWSDLGEGVTGIHNFTATYVAKPNIKWKNSVLRNLTFSNKGSLTEVLAFNNNKYCEI